MSRKRLFIFFSTLILLQSNALHAKDPLHVILVDKATHKLHLAEYDSTKIKTIKSFHVTTGKIEGDKEIEKDLKTPEGIYFFRSIHTPPTLKKKFGIKAIMLDYPNPIDRRSGKTGYDIMLHATDDPTRLQRDLDSEGCVVIDNHEIEEVSKYIKLGVTPILIYSKMTDDFLIPEQNLELKNAFDSWIKAWEGKDIEGYIGSYTSDFVYNGMNLKKYKEYKNTLNSKYKTISVDPQNIRYFRHPKYDVVMFTQNYLSTLSNGASGFKSVGTKFLYFLKENGKYKISVEDYTNFKE
jgi:murein L,D-transpeptidase YafK